MRALRFLFIPFFLFSALCSVGCVHRYPAPDPIDTQHMLRALGRGFRVVFPEPQGPDAQRDAGLLRPRFGVPAIVRRDDSFTVEILERGGPVEVRAALVRSDLSEVAATACLSAPPTLPSSLMEDCHRLRLDEMSRLPVPSESGGPLVMRTLSARLERPAPARVYDLLLMSAVDPPQRARRAVFLTEFDPQAPRPLRVVQISDVHLGKLAHVGQVQERLSIVIREINRRAPDLVIVTGDVADQGRTMGLMLGAHTALLQIDAPVLITLGNHDHGLFPRIRHLDQPDPGWLNFSRVFHPYRFTRHSFGGWDFVGFDSGQSVFSPLILTRGIDEGALKSLQKSLNEAMAQNRRGVILYSHAPTRAVLRSFRADPHGDGLGSMIAGARELEELLLAAATRQQRVLHISGHTHWSDVFVALRSGQGMEFSRWAHDKLFCPRSLDGTVAMVNAPSATVITFPTIHHGRNFGFVELHLDDTRTTLHYNLHDRRDQPVDCK